MYYNDEFLKPTSLRHFMVMIQIFLLIFIDSKWNVSTFNQVSSLLTSQHCLQTNFG